ncbi:MAG: hypothetical protein EON60_12415 [Alphaproteobacteria bacterium]|nr:MAG: hypothetical protein EON60_12415 [Alphaproteobacteria bacterium]
MKDSVKNHPLFIKALPLKQAYLQSLADDLAVAVKNKDPLLAHLAKQVLFDSGVSLVEASTRIKATNVVAMLEKVEKDNDAQYITTFANIVIAMLAEQLPHPPEGL